MMEHNDRSQPLVSVGVLSYNRGHKIGATIQSILNQNYKNLEILISDNASDDNDETVDACRKYIQRDKRITLFIQKINIGPYRNCEFLANQARGKYFMWLNDDDNLEPHVISRFVDFLENNEEYNLVSGQIQYWKDDEVTYVEKDLSLESDNNLRRVLAYYSKVREGAIFYGLMRAADLRNIKFIKKRLAGDWHVVAHMAYLAKIKQLDFVSMNKSWGGFSADLERYASIVGADKMSARFPFLSIGLDTLKDVWHNSKIYGRETRIARFIVGMASCIAIWVNYYFLSYPKIVGGKIKRFFALPSMNSVAR